jgi:hypothetical protein
LWWFFDFPDVFIEFALDERIKPTTVAVYLFTTAFATIFAISLEKTNCFGENCSAVLIFGGVYLVTI